MKVSIIVPIYNTRDRLRICLESILAQDYKDYECLMIDDGSNLDTALIIDEYAKVDSRFIAIHKKNGGVSSARNKGLEIAKGDWICFVDSDDAIKPSHISSFIQTTRPDVDMVLCGYENVLGIGKNEYHTYANSLYIGLGEVKKFIQETDVLWYMIPWDKFFRTDIIHNNKIVFNNNLTISEDRLFVYNYLKFTRGIITLSNVSYIHKADDEASLSRRPVSIEMQKTRYKLMVKAKNDLIRSMKISSKEAIMLNSYNENLLVLMLDSGVKYRDLLTLIGFDTYVIVKLIIKRLIHK